MVSNEAFSLLLKNFNSDHHKIFIFKTLELFSRHKINNCEMSKMEFHLNCREADSHKYHVTSLGLNLTVGWRRGENMQARVTVSYQWIVKIVLYVCLPHQVTEEKFNHETCVLLGGCLVTILQLTYHLICSFLLPWLGSMAAQMVQRNWLQRKKYVLNLKIFCWCKTYTLIKN